jgi:hypothetical protein
MSSPPSAWRRRVALVASEPTVQFFFLGALLFLAHRLVAGDARVITVTPGVRAEVARRFRDRSGRPPTPPEMDGELRAWKRDEALYREALRDRLDRDDAAVRTVLADRVRARAALAIPRREPSQADLDRWLATHRGLYEAPRRYDYELVSFPKAQPASAAQREKYEQAVASGASPAALGRPIVGANLAAEDLKQRLGPALAAQVQALPVGRWQRLESDDNLLLVRLNGVGGGMPEAGELRKRLVADWSFAERQRAVDEAVQALVDRYRFREEGR